MGRIRLQVILALLAIALVSAGLTYVAYSVTTVSVPDYGGTYVEGLAGNPRAINPIYCQSNPVDQDLVSLLFEGLVRIDEQGQAQPQLATHWEITSNGAVYTFYLRDDVTWHDGAPFSAADVIYTFEALRSPDYDGSAYLAEMWRTVVVQQVDAYTVRMNLREPFAPFLDYCSVGILPVHILAGLSVSDLANARFNASPIGTGPFMVDEVSAQYIAFVVNPGYYGARPYLDRVEFQFYPDYGAIYDARLRGEIDGIARVLPEHLNAVRQDDSLTLYSAPLSAYNLIYLNLDRGIFQDPSVRKAMLYSLDRQKMVDDILQGQGIVLHSPIMPNSWAYADDVPQYDLDLNKAAELLETSGWFDDDNDGVREHGDLKLEFTLLTNDDDPIRIALAEAAAEQLADSGILVHVETTDWETLVGEHLRLRRYDAVLSGWQELPTNPDPYPYWHSSQANENGLNFGNYVSGQADLCLSEARYTADPALRTEYLREFQHMFASQVPALLLYQPVYSYAVDSEVKNVQIGPMVSSADRLNQIAAWTMQEQRMLYRQAREQGLPVSR